MAAAKTSTLTSFFRQGARSLTKTPSRSSFLADDPTFKQAVSSCESQLKHETASTFDDSKKLLSQQISSILRGDDSASSADSQEALNDNSSNTELNIPSIPILSYNSLLSRKKDLSHKRKASYSFKSSQNRRIEKIVRNCAVSLGTDATFDLLEKMGKEAGEKEFNVFIGTYVEHARTSDDTEAAQKYIEEAFKFFTPMIERGFQITDEAYGPLLMYFIDMGLTEDFLRARERILKANPGQLPRIGYYEMLLWIEVGNEEKIQELCSSIVTDVESDNSSLKENYLLALCERDRMDDILTLLELIDITKVLSKDYAENIYKFFGRQSLESVAEKFLSELINNDRGAENVSNLIFKYTTSIPNLAVEDVVLKFTNLHSKLEIKPSSASYEKLIAYICDMQKAHIALDVVEQMREAGLSLSIDILRSILRSSELCEEYNLVHQINSVISRHKLKPSSEIFRIMISLSAKIGDLDGARKILSDVKETGLIPTSSMYNAIIAGHLKKNSLDGALMVLKEMENEGVKPDSHTYSLLLNNCDTEEDIIKYSEEMKHTGVAFTKNIFMSLIKAYAACGQFEKAKQVILSNEIPDKSINEIKGVLVSALASHGQMDDALDTYEEIKQSGSNIDPNLVISLIKHCQPEVELSTLLQLLDELHELYDWTEGCCQIICHCVRYKKLSYAADFMKKLTYKLSDDVVVLDKVFEEVFAQIAETEPTDLETGLYLFRFIKDELDITLSRKCLDFLLSACAKANDINHGFMIWKEYTANGLPYNVLSFLRMYQLSLASGAYETADSMLSNIPKDDPHVQSVVEALQNTYLKEETVDGGADTSEGEGDTSEGEGERDEHLIATENKLNQCDVH